MKINNGHRRRQKELRLSALNIGAKYGKKLYSSRLSETLRVVDLFVEIPENKIIEQAPLMLNELLSFIQSSGTLVPCHMNIE